MGLDRRRVYPQLSSNPSPSRTSEFTKKKSAQTENENQRVSGSTVQRIAVLDLIFLDSTGYDGLFILPLTYPYSTFQRKFFSGGKKIITAAAVA